MDLPVMPPVAPMLAKSVKDIPAGALGYEPKWDGFRSVVFRDGAEVEIGSRNERPMTRYFPEVVDALLASLPERCVVDGEIVIPAADGSRLDFEALLQRIHPADSRVRLLARQTPASFVAFDLLALGDEDYTGLPFERRRKVLEEALADVAAPVYVTPATRDRDTAVRWFSQFEGAGLDGVVAKPLAGTYQPDKRVMFKIKHERTADCVVAGYRVHKSGPDAIGSLLLGLYDSAGRLASVGVVGAFPMAVRRQLFTEVQPLVTSFEGHPWNWGGEPAPGLGGSAVDAGAEPEAAAGQQPTRARHPREAEGSRWNAGKDLSFVPLRPERVAEVRYEHMEGTRFRHTAQWVHWRPDRDPASCGFDQLEEPVHYNLAEVLTAGRTPHLQ
ncbi:MAG TPA: ATP-dependent DNA ligase [Streptosporangiaceae bacterium]|nr:ATP-dependent DNA ligase [Streptosporangiaceae bacterium]